MSAFVKQSTNIDSGVEKIDWLVDVNDSRSFTSKVGCRFLQMQQISSLPYNLSNLDKIVLKENSKIELKWLVQNLELCNDRMLIKPPAEVLIQTDASTKGWGTTCNGISTGGMWSAQVMKNHINV